MVMDMRKGQPKANQSISLTMDGLERITAIKQFLSKDTHEEWKLSHIIEGLLYIFEKNMRVTIANGKEEVGE